MVLPSWLWKILRNRRFRMGLAWGTPAAVLLAALAFALGNLRGTERYRSFVAGLQARGMATTLHTALGPELPEEDNFFAHPDVMKIIRDGLRETGEIAGGSQQMRSTSSFTFDEGRTTYYEWEPRNPPAPTGLISLKRLIHLCPELDGFAQALQRKGARPLEESPPRYFDNNLHDAVLTLGARGIGQVGEGNLAAAEGDATALLRGARTLLGAELPLDDKLMVSTTLSAGIAILQEGLWLGRWDAAALTRFDELLAALEPHQAMISGLRCNLSISAERGPRNIPETSLSDTVGIWHSYDSTRATWPQRAQAIWYHQRPRGFWLGDLAERGECVDAWLRDRSRFTAADWQRLRPEFLRLVDSSLIPREQGMPLGHVALAAGQALELETQISMARIAIELERGRLATGRFPENPFASQPELARTLLIDPWTGARFQLTPGNGGTEVEIRSLGPDGVADQARADWNDFTEGDRVWKCGRFEEE